MFSFSEHNIMYGYFSISKHLVGINCVLYLNNRLIYILTIGHDMQSAISPSSAAVNLSLIFSANLTFRYSMCVLDQITSYTVYGLSRWRVA